MKRALLDELLLEARAKRPVVLATDLGRGAQQLHRSGEAGPLAEAVERALRRDEAQRVEDWFLQPFNPPLRLLVVGAVHVAQPLVAMARLAGYEVVIVDPRDAFASAARFPEVALRSEWPDRALEQLAPDARTAVVTLTHDPKLDEPALCVALRSPAFYVGALGSRKTHAARLERLRALGVADDALARIHAPVGLAIGARSPAEIAISILAQMTLRLRRSDA